MYYYCFVSLFLNLFLLRDVAGNFHVSLLVSKTRIFIFVYIFYALFLFFFMKAVDLDN